MRLIENLKSFKLFVLALAALSWGFPALAQWTTQSISLEPGWNAIFLEVQPEPRESDQLFAGLTVDSVWMWNGRFNTVQYIEDPDTLVPEHPDWLTYVPPGDPRSVATNLHTIEGGKAYLIKLAGQTPELWSVTGRPVHRAVDWLAGSYNLVGFPVNETVPSFAQFFNASPAHANLDIYRLTPTGDWQAVPTTKAIERGQAYFVHSASPTNYNGSLNVSFDHGSGVDFGSIAIERSVRLRNLSPSPQAVTVSRPDSEPVDVGDTLFAGPVPLSYWTFDPTTNGGVWLPLSPQFSRTLEPGEEFELRLAVRRGDFAEFSAEEGKTALYQSLLEIIGTDVRVVLPVSAEGSGAASVAKGVSQGLGEPVNTFAGLWTGTATVNRVSYPASVNDPNTPLETPTPYQVRLLVHVDIEGTARLLQQVTQMWKEPTYVPSPDDPNFQVVDQPGRFVLATNDAIVSQFSGSAMRDGTLTGRRISSTTFSHREPLAMEPGGAFGGELDFEVDIAHDDPLNPFLHRYHPDHDNLDARFENPLPPERESFTVLRDIQLEFTPEDPDNLSLAGYGDSYIGGVYRESLTGLHRNTLHVGGTFRLHRVSRVGVLNDGMPTEN